ncbi:MAG TPA: HAD family hydrolase [Candidatus Saccharimonadales bacterium]|nr:HAD family hydrolase [Candidatus Saccharimonadales bacterium]
MGHNGSQPVTTIIFDWSGTISDDRQMVYQANMRVREDHGYPPIDFAEFLANIKLTAPEAFKEMGLLGTKEELQAIYTSAVEYVKEKGISPTVYEDATEAFKNLASQAIKLAVLSSHPERHVQSEAESFGLQFYFDPISGDCHDKTIGIRSIMDRLGVDNENSVMYVGDTIYDIRAAKLAGVISAGIATGYMDSVRLMNEEPDHLFYSLTDIVNSNFLGLS